MSSYICNNNHINYIFIIILHNFIGNGGAFILNRKNLNMLSSTRTQTITTTTTTIFIRTFLENKF